MDILQLNCERGWRGGERQTLLCMRQFRQAGHVVSLLARAGGQLAAQTRSEGFTVHEFTSAAGGCGFLLRSEEHTSELQSLMRISYAVFCLKKKTNILKN